MREAPPLALLVLAAAGFSLAAGAADFEGPRLGRPVPADVAARASLNVFPDGRGLPPGKGTAAEGRAIYDAQCATCHGEGGRGATAEELVSEPQPLNVEGASKAIGPYWPYATTIFDFIRRSMPAHAPGSLTSDEVYAVTAYLLAANKIIAETDVIDAATLPKVKMPNRDGFDWIDVKK